MKFYLTSFLLFLSLSCGIINGFAQENVSQETADQPSASTDVHMPSDEHHHSSKSLHPTHSDLPDSLIERVENESDTFQAKFFNMLFILALLIGFMILASWALKRLMKTKLTQLNTGSSLKVLETRYLSPRATLYLVEVQNRTLLIAESPTAVTFLTELSEKTGPHA